MDSDEFAKFVLDKAEKMRAAGEAPGPWPMAHHDPDGRQVEVILEEGDYYAQWLDSRVTLYKQRETDKVIGFCVSFPRNP